MRINISLSTAQLITLVQGKFADGREWVGLNAESPKYAMQIRCIKNGRPIRLSNFTVVPSFKTSELTKELDSVFKTLRPMFEEYLNLHNDAQRLTLYYKIIALLKTSGE